MILDAERQEGWVLEALRQALAVPGVQLGTIVVARADEPRGLAANLHRVVDLVDRKLRCGGDQLFEFVDVAARLGVAAPTEIPLARSGDQWVVEAPGLATLREARADLWLCFCARPPQSPFPPVCRLGVWGLEIGAQVPATSAWAGATEVGSRSDLTVSQVVDYAQPGRNVVYRASGATIKNSARRNRLLVLRKAVSFFGRLLRAATSDRSAARRTQVLEPALLPAACRDPSAPAVLRLSWRLATQVLSNRWRALASRDQWQIGYYFGDEGAEANYPPGRLRNLVPPRDRDWADPFIVQHQERTFIFFEELPYSAGKGHISAVEVYDNGETGTPLPVLVRPYHLSYPFVFAWNGELYMLPESAENGTVELYRCEEFPHRWALHRVLLEGLRAYDATLLREGERWWLFVNVAEPGADPSEELHLYCSQSPLGPWVPHRSNPVVSDVRHARSAGPLFRRAGVLYRPSQDCSAAYGGAVSINRVDLLDAGGYRETPVGRIDPDRESGMRCLHTFGAAGKLRVVDFQVRRPRWRWA